LLTSFGAAERGWKHGSDVALSKQVTSSYNNGNGKGNGNGNGNKFNLRRFGGSGGRAQLRAIRIKTKENSVGWSRGDTNDNLNVWK